MRTLCDVDFTPPVEGETLETHAPAFWRWLDRAAGGRAEKRDVILAALFMVLANRYDWQLFLEVTGPGGSGKSIMAEIATLLAGEDNATSATIETLESPRERAALTGFTDTPAGPENGAATVPDSRPSPAAMRCPLTRNTGMHTPRISRR